MLVWKDKYKIGLELVDTQHEKLFELAGEIYDLVKINEDTDKYDQIVEVLQELKDYTVFHFQEEEAYMLEIQYPKFFSHKILHAEFIEKVNSVNITSLDDDQTKYLLEMLTFVLDWLQNHILKVDTEIV
ncbi:MAG TPA: hemerythrin family protein [Epulopiscium sp.]|nr:hemerythrin family protein [Candidatus Epulonipiscium sp.]